MKYLLMIYQNEESWDAITDAERQKIHGEYGALGRSWSLRVSSLAVLNSIPYRRRAQCVFVTASR